MLKINRKWLFFPILATGILIFIIAIKTRPEIPIKPAISKARQVDVLTLKNELIAPEIIGFGLVKPKRSWQAIAEVSGKVIYRHPELEKGRVLAKNTQVLKIDPSDHEIAIAQANSDISAIKARLSKLELDNKSLKTKLGIEKRRLTLRENELTRQKNLKKKNLISQSAFEAEQQAFYVQQAQVEELENQYNLLPLEQKIAEAEFEGAKLALAKAKRDLARTEITLPFSARIASVNIEQAEVVTNNQVMIEAHALDAVEVEAQVSIHDMQVLLASLDSRFDDNFARRLEELSANVVLSSGSFSQRWPAKVVALSDTITANQASVGIILEINLADKQKNQLTAAPSLVNGMFVKASITGKSSEHKVVPESALRGERLYLYKEDKLEILPVEVLFRQNEQAVVTGDFPDNALLVLNDLIPALDGMSLQMATLDGQKILKGRLQ